MNEEKKYNQIPVKPRKLSGAAKMILSIIIVLLLGGGYYFKDTLFGPFIHSKSAVETSGYQAVFLTNNQVYFGKITDMNGSYVTLANIYYLQVVQPLQGTTQTEAQKQQQISLIKLGKELHGPTDEMHINRDQILFYEDLRSDSDVIKAINTYGTDGGNNLPAQ